MDINRIVQKEKCHLLGIIPGDDILKKAEKENETMETRNVPNRVAL